MPDPSIQQLNDARTEGVARVDESIEPGSANWQRYYERIGELLNEPGQRDDEIWAKSIEFNEADPASITLTWIDLAAVHEDDRDKEWQDTVEAFGDAASSQAYAEILFIPLMEATQKSTVNLLSTAGDVGPSTVKAAKDEPPGKQQYQDAKDRRKAKRDGTANDADS